MIKKDIVLKCTRKLLLYKKMPQDVTAALIFDLKC